MSDRTTKQIGDHGEELAASYLEAKGWLIFDRNYRFEKAELDIVATDRNYIIFVEVKTRSNTYFGRPEEYVTPIKKRNMKKAAEDWIYERKMETAVCRVDVIVNVEQYYGAP